MLKHWVLVMHWKNAKHIYWFLKKIVLNINLNWFYTLTAYWISRYLTRYHISHFASIKLKYGHTRHTLCVGFCFSLHKLSPAGKGFLQSEMKYVVWKWRKWCPLLSSSEVGSTVRCYWMSVVSEYICGCKDVCTSTQSQPAIKNNTD